ncbi:hypothetical protein TWF694_010782 [Orbilia ellipsospora]|uniref:Uncharacterized protein n=1 Tax=Orbilia ellipsospora TaxID=2528407 RepID=A0AAV9X9M9_9PEZI
MSDQHHNQPTQSNSDTNNNNAAAAAAPASPPPAQHPLPLLPPLNTPVSFTGHPIPPARINHSISSGRPGPIVTIPVPTDLNGKPDYSRKPGLDLRHIVRRGVGNDTIENNSEPVEHSNDNGESSSSGDGLGKDNSCTDTDSHSPQNSIMASLTKPENEPPSQPPETDAKQVTSILSQKLPPELIPAILDEASYFPHAIIGSSEKTKSVTDGDKIYLVAHIPDFEAFDEDTRGKGGIGGGRQGRVRKLVFKISSKDQGWSSYGRDHGTYRGAWSWLEVELWRGGEKPKPRPKTGPAMLAEDVEADAGGEEKNEEEEEVKEESEDSDEEERLEAEMNNGKYEVGSWLLQRNKHAVWDHTHHEVVWDWKEDELEDENDMKWEDDTLKEDGGRDRWQRGGKQANGELIRMLEGGDEIRVIMKARYPGWRCEVQSCEIECFWAI